MSNPGDTVATWNLKLNDGPHTVTFEHGTTSGKRVITVDGREVYIKLVFEECERERELVNSPSSKNVMDISGLS